MAGLKIDLTSSLNSNMNCSMESTYRIEGLSVGNDHMRFFGEDIPMEVSYYDVVLGKKIGQGACSSVNLARHKRTNDVYAIKMFNTFDREQASQLQNELKLLISFQCDTLISLKGAFHDEGSIGIILEYMDRGSIDFILKPEVELNEPVMAGITFQVLWGLGYLHFEKQLHRDVKPGNILMNSLGQVKLSDFGISRELDFNSTVGMTNTYRGSVRYMSPERLRGENYDSTGDVWSVGVTMLELWLKRYPFRNTETPISLLGEIERTDFRRLFKGLRMSDHMQQCLLEMLDLNPYRRLHSADLINMSWFEYCNSSTLTTAQQIVQSWIYTADYNNNRKSNRNSSVKSSIPAVVATTTAAAAANKKPIVVKQRGDMNEMSISFGSSHASSASMNLSVASSHVTVSTSSEESTQSSSSSQAETKQPVAYNPFTSSGNLTASMKLNTAASRYRDVYDMGYSNPTEEEEYGDDFDEDDDDDPVEPYEDDSKQCSENQFNALRHAKNKHSDNRYDSDDRFYRDDDRTYSSDEKTQNKAEYSHSYKK